MMVSCTLWPLLAWAGEAVSVMVRPPDFATSGDDAGPTVVDVVEVVEVLACRVVPVVGRGKVVVGPHPAATMSTARNTRLAPRAGPRRRSPTTSLAISFIAISGRRPRSGPRVFR